MESKPHILLVMAGVVNYLEAGEGFPKFSVGLSIIVYLDQNMEHRAHHGDD